jgi:hypothetical protein
MRQRVIRNLVFAAALAAFGAVLLWTPAPLRAASGLPSVAGTWTGKLKSKRFPLSTVAQKPQTLDVTLTLVQTSGALSNGTIFSIQRTGTSAEAFGCTGQTGNGNLDATGTSAFASVSLSAHVNKTANGMTGKGIIYSADAVEEITFTLKKQPLN